MSANIKKRFGTLILLVMLAGGAFAGVPLHFGESSACPNQSEMGDMDCCEMALLQNQTPEVAGAKLCCVLNCAQGGTTSPPASVRIAPPVPAGLLHYAPMPQPVVRTALSRRAYSQHGPPGSPPAYLLNLAFLI
jgi:hypothetical protein